MTGFAPGIELRRVFENITSVAASRLGAYFFGPAADVYDYVAGGDNVGKLGQYNPEATTLVDGVAKNVFTYPEKRLGGTVDLDTTKLYITNALLKYFEDTGGNAVKKSRNSIHLADTVVRSGNGAFADVNLPSREVQIGDVVRIKATIPEVGAYELNSYITGFIADKKAVVIGSPVAGAANAVEPAGAPVSTVTAVANGAIAANSTIEAVGDIENYEGYASGRLQETYTIEALNSSVAGSVANTRFRITSADGQDNVADTLIGSGGVLTVGTRGATVTFTAEAGESILIGQRWVFSIKQEYEAPTVTITGAYTGTRSRTYIIEIVEGGVLGDDIVARVLTEDGSDQSGPFTLVKAVGAATVPVALGNYGLLFSLGTTFGLVTGDRWKVTATAAADDKIRTIVLAHSLSEAITVDTPMNIQVEFMLRRSIEVPRMLGGTTVWEARENDILVSPGMTVYLSDVTDKNGADLPLEVVRPVVNNADNQAELAYRVFHPRSTELLTLSSETSLDTAVPGPTSVDNPLKLMLSVARADAGGVPLYYFCVGDPSVEANWDAALKAVTFTTQVNGLVPLTQDPVIQQKVHAHAVAMSGPLVKRWRRAWLSLSMNKVKQITNADEVELATILDDPDTAGLQSTLVGFTSEVDLLDLGVRPGDVLRYNYGIDLHGNVTYDEAVIDRVINADTLKLKTSIGEPEIIARKVEIHRNLQGADFIPEFQSKLTAYDEFARVFMPEYQIGTQTVPGFYAAGAMAARRSGYLPHRPMTNTDVNTFTGTPWEDLFEESDINDLAFAGMFLFTRDPASGLITVRHAITAGDYTNVLLREESVQANADDLSFRVAAKLSPIFGKLNRNTQTLARINTEIASLANEIASEGINSPYGPQVISLDSSGSRFSPAERDTILVDIIGETQVPANRIRTTMYFV
jgi:hypothetical protein